MSVRIDLIILVNLLIINFYNIDFVFSTLRKLKDKEVTTTKNLVSNHQKVKNFEVNKLKEILINI